MMKLHPHDRRARDERGTAFVATLFATAALGAMAYATTILASTEVNDSRRSLMDMKTLSLAEAGIEQSVAWVQDVIKKSQPDPITGVENALSVSGVLTERLLFDALPVLDGGSKVGEYTSSVRAKKRDGGLDLVIRATGYFPAAPKNMRNKQNAPRRKSIEVTVRLEHEPGSVFDYAYFINNWGWLYGNTIFCNGNLRSNGQFDAGGYAPTIEGQTTYEGFEWIGGSAHLLGYMDSNKDGLQDGNDGGIWSGWDIVGHSNVKGLGGQSQNQHDFQNSVEMPNLSDLSVYERKATGSIKVGGVTMSDSVYGDNPSEKQNLYLVGTKKDPIEITGTVVVRGHVVIQGVVKGQGSIYSGGNVYIPSNVEYFSSPTSKRPHSTTQADTQGWITSNKSRDMLGLFARENIVAGDFTNSTWRSYVGWWLGHSNNQSAEDAGEDLIPNTLKGRDGIAKTADDDVLEGDGVWTVERYSKADLAAGLIPAGKNVGDPIPATGEDIDGDGVQDMTLTLADLELPSGGAMSSSDWGGNLPVGGVSKYSDIASMKMTNIDATLYTNHAMAWTALPGSGNDIEVNGALIARNEAIIYGADSITFNYDCRLLGGNQGFAQTLFELPQVVAPLRTVSWRALDFDPYSEQMKHAWDRVTATTNGGKVK